MLRYSISFVLFFFMMQLLTCYSNNAMILLNDIDKMHTNLGEKDLLTQCKKVRFATWSSIYIFNRSTIYSHRRIFIAPYPRAHNCFFSLNIVKKMFDLPPLGDPNNLFLYNIHIRYVEYAC